MTADIGRSNAAVRLGEGSAWWLAVTIVLFDIGAALGAAGWPTGIWPAAASLLIIPAFVCLSVCLHLRADPADHPWTLSALLFAAAYAAILFLNYGLQISVVRWFPERYDLLSLDFTPQSAFWAVEIVAYAVQALAAVFLLPAIRRGRFGKTIAAIFILNAVGVVLAVAAYLVTANPAHPLGLLSMVVWGALFPVAAVLLALRFRSGG